MLLQRKHLTEKQGGRWIYLLTFIGDRSIFCFVKELTYLHTPYIFFPYDVPPVITWHGKHAYVSVSCSVYFPYSSVRK